MEDVCQHQLCIAQPRCLCAFAGVGGIVYVLPHFGIVYICLFRHRAGGVSFLLEISVAASRAQGGRDTAAVHHQEPVRLKLV